MSGSAIHLHAIREQAPLVHCITNYVAMNVAANTLLAIGASPAMVHTPEESGEFAGLAGALTVNMGTPDPRWVEGLVAATAAAREAETPWVLDPVAHMATSYRRNVVTDLLAQKPTVIRGNASEILALAGSTSQGKGVDSGDSVADAEASSVALAKTQKAVVAITGEVDFVTDGFRCARVRGGSAWMPRVTAMGCSLTAVMGATLAVGTDPFEATIAALDCFGVCGSLAADTAQAPGSFQVAFLDALALLTPQEVSRRSRVEVL